MPLARPQVRQLLLQHLGRKEPVADLHQVALGIYVEHRGYARVGEGAVLLQPLELTPSFLGGQIVADEFDAAGIVLLELVDDGLLLLAGRSGVAVEIDVLRAAGRLGDDARRPHVTVRVGCR